MHLSMPRRSIPSSLGGSCRSVLFSPCISLSSWLESEQPTVALQRAAFFHTGRYAEIFQPKKQNGSGNNYALLAVEECDGGSTNTERLSHRLPGSPPGVRPGAKSRIG